MTTKRTEAGAFLEKIIGRPLTIGSALLAIRQADEINQADFAKTLGISAQNLCDIEKDRTQVSPLRAYQWAKKLGYHEQHFVSLALQGTLDSVGLDFQVSLSKPEKKKKSKKTRAA